MTPPNMGGKIFDYLTGGLRDPPSYHPKGTTNFLHIQGVLITYMWKLFCILAV
jgi:hypothetical protein